MILLSPEQGIPTAPETATMPVSCQIGFQDGFVTHQFAPRTPHLQTGDGTPGLPPWEAIIKQADLMEKCIRVVILLSAKEPGASSFQRPGGDKSPEPCNIQRGIPRNGFALFIGADGRETAAARDKPALEICSHKVNSNVPSSRAVDRSFLVGGHKGNGEQWDPLGWELAWCSVPENDLGQVGQPVSAASQHLGLGFILPGSSQGKDCLQL